MFFYSIGIWFYRLGIILASFRSEKAKQWLNGRQNWRSDSVPPKQGERYWFHCASLGEFEQARPLIEHYHTLGIDICLSFFSPSGYEARKSYALASWVGYLPLDGKAAASYFVKKMDADRIFFVKYEFWYFFLMEIKKQKIPFYLISARFRKEQPFFHWYGYLHRKMLKAYTHIFTQDKASVQLLSSIGAEAIFAGDTRFDRVSQMPTQRKLLPIIDSFCKDAFVVIAGSSWPEEEVLIKDAMPNYPDFKWVIVPHDISETHLKGIEDRFKGKSIRYSAIESGQVAGEKQVLIVDKIGLLGNIYPYGNLALIGGGFSNALHNILEAAVWGMPVCYGEYIRKYPEGLDLAKSGGGFLLETKEDFIDLIHRMQNSEFHHLSGQKAAEWIEDKRGATEIILHQIDPSTSD